MQRLAFLGSLRVYLEHERLATKNEIADMLGGSKYMSFLSSVLLEL